MLRSIVGQLAVASVGFVVLATLAAAVPVYWITRAQLETQALDRLQAARLATRSLYTATGDRVQSAAALFAERPTLIGLAQIPGSPVLQPYMVRFQAQSQIDLLLLCSPELTPVAGIPVAHTCFPPQAPAIALVDDRPYLIASSRVIDREGRLAGIATAGVALDAAFVAELARSTSSEQSLITGDGTRLATTLPGPSPAVISDHLPTADRPARLIPISTTDRTYGAVVSRLPVSQLPGSPAPTPFYAEIALPIDSLLVTERSVLAMFVLSTGLVALLGGFASVLLVRRLTAPLARITGVAERISHGDFTAEIPSYTGPREVATLASGLQRSQRAMLQAMEERARAQAFRNDFLDNVTHELRTPLSTLNASLELLLDPGESFTPQEVRTVLQPAHVSMVTLQQLIDNLLASGSIEAGRFVLQRQVTDINPIIAAAFQVTQPLLERRRQSVTIVRVARQPALAVDPARIVQALVNLLNNASKYSPLGAPIELSVAPAGVWLRVAVADRGPGLPPDATTDLFERYVRGDNRRNDSDGAGLGLFIVKTIIQAHGGAVGVENRPGGGAVFWFTVPTAATEAENSNG